MQWGQIKTIFIFCFLILDIYLIMQVVTKENEPPLITNPGTVSLEEELNERNINYENITNETTNAAYISATWHTFTEEEVETLKDQEVLNNGNMIYSVFSTPILLGKDRTAEEILLLLGDKVLHFEDYRYYRWNKENNTLLFFQQYEDKPLYYNNGGMIMFFLNDQYEVTSYAQTLQTNIDDLSEEKELSKPLEIVKALLNQNKVFSGDTITSMKLGYHTYFPVSETIQAFVPTWKVNVNEDEVYFVNAQDGQIIDINEDNFITNIKSEINKMKSKFRSEES